MYELFIHLSVYMNAFVFIVVINKHRVESKRHDLFYFPNLI